MQSVYIVFGTPGYELKTVDDGDIRVRRGGFLNDRYALVKGGALLDIVVSPQRRDRQNGHVGVYGG